MQGLDVLSHRRQVVGRCDDAVLDCLERRLQGRQRGPEIMARPRLELPSGIEQILELGRHVVERHGHVGHLAGAAFLDARPKVPARHASNGAAESLERRGDRGGHQQRSRHGDRRRRNAHGQDDGVGAHMEHGDPGEQDRCERDERGRHREPDESGVDRRQASDEERSPQAGGERPERHRESEQDHGVNR